MEYKEKVVIEDNRNPSTHPCLLGFTLRKRSDNKPQIKTVIKNLNSIQIIQIKHGPSHTVHDPYVLTDPQRQTVHDN